MGWIRSKSTNGDGPLRWLARTHVLSASQQQLLLWIMQSHLTLLHWAVLPRPAAVGDSRHGRARRFFYFFYFSISFFTKIYFCFRNLQEYTPAAPLPDGWHLAAPLQGGRGFSTKTFAENLHRVSGGPVARQRGDGSWPPASRVTGSPTVI